MYSLKDPSYDKDSMRTPKYIFDYFNSIYSFDVDLAASDDFHFCENYFSMNCGALDMPWANFTAGWCNPPYSNIDPWIDKAIQESNLGFTTVMLIPSLNGEERGLVIERYASSIIDIVPRISFVRPDTNSAIRSNNRGSIVVEFSRRPKWSLIRQAKRKRSMLNLKTIEGYPHPKKRKKPSDLYKKHINN